MNYDDIQMKSIDRVESAIKVRNQAFIKMRNEFYPAGSGVVSEDTLKAFDAADAEFNAAKAEMDQIAAEIRNEIHN